MPNRNFSSRAAKSTLSNAIASYLLALLALSPFWVNASELNIGEKLEGYYAREGNDGSPAETAGNNIYLKFFDDRWVGMLFVPYPYAIDLEPQRIERAFETARAQANDAAYLRGRFDAFDELATAQIERYGYLDDRIAFECGALSACTVKLAEGHLELIKPGVINPHIVRYIHVEAN